MSDLQELRNYYPNLTSTTHAEHIAMLRTAIMSPPTTRLLYIALSELVDVFETGDEAVLGSLKDYSFAESLMLLSTSDDYLSRPYTEEKFQIAYYALWCLNIIIAGEHQLITGLVRAGLLKHLKVPLVSCVHPLTSTVIECYCVIAYDSQENRNRIFEEGFLKLVSDRAQNHGTMELLMPSVLYLHMAMLSNSNPPSPELVKACLEVAHTAFKISSSATILADACLLCERLVFNRLADIEYAYKLQIPFHLGCLIRREEKELRLMALGVLANLLGRIEHGTDEVLSPENVKLYLTFSEAQAEEEREEAMRGLSQATEEEDILHLITNAADDASQLN